jgi:predicted DNA-binding protein
MEEDGYTRITLRIPKDLHAQLTELSQRTSKSMNAQIIECLRKGVTDLRADFMFRRLLTRTMAQLEKELPELVNDEERMAAMILLAKEEAIRMEEFDKKLANQLEEIEINVKAGLLPSEDPYKNVDKRLYFETNEIEDHALSAKTKKKSAPK